MGKSRASHFEAKKKVQVIRTFYELGCEALKLPSSMTIAEKAEKLDCTEAQLGVARRFAIRYSDDQLDELCDLVLKHRPVFGTAHVEILITIPQPRRSKYQSRCIKKNWSRRELIAAKTKRIQPKSKGGRPPEVTDRNVVFHLNSYANADCHLVARISKPREGQPSILDGLDPEFRHYVEVFETAAKRLRKVAHARLKQTQQAN